MTNFHLPRTTLLMMIDAFVGPRWRALYDEALADDYRFLSLRRRDAAAHAEHCADASGRVRASRPPTAPPGPAWPTPPAARYRTPCFMPVGTRGAIKYLSAADYERARRARSCSATPTT